MALKRPTIDRNIAYIDTHGRHRKARSGPCSPIYRYEKIPLSVQGDFLLSVRLNIVCNERNARENGEPESRLKNSIDNHMTLTSILQIDFMLVRKTQSKAVRLPLLPLSSPDALLLPVRPAHTCGHCSQSVQAFHGIQCRWSSRESRTRQNSSRIHHRCTPRANDSGEV